MGEIAKPYGLKTTSQTPPTQTTVLWLLLTTKDSLTWFLSVAAIFNHNQNGVKIVRNSIDIRSTTPDKLYQPLKLDLQDTAFRSWLSCRCPGKHLKRKKYRHQKLVVSWMSRKNEITGKRRQDLGNTWMSSWGTAIGDKNEFFMCRRKCIKPRWNAEIPIYFALKTLRLRIQLFNVRVSCNGQEPLSQQSSIILTHPRRSTLSLNCRLWKISVLPKNWKFGSRICISATNLAKKTWKILLERHIRGICNSNWPQASNFGSLRTGLQIFRFFRLNT